MSPCGASEHPAAPFVGGLCDGCCRAAASKVSSTAAQQPATPTSGGWSVGRFFGVILMILGAGGAVSFLGANTSVQLGPEFGGQRVHNLSLGQQQLVGMIFSLAMFMGGLLIVLFLKKR